MSAPWSARRLAWTGAALVFVCIFSFYAMMFTSLMRMTECRHFGFFEAAPCYAAAFWELAVLGCFLGAPACFLMALRRRARQERVTAEEPPS